MTNSDSTYNNLQVFFLFTGPRRNIFEVEPTLHPDICGLDETVFHRAHTLHAHPRS